MRGRAARRRRGAGHRGADGRERLPRDRERPRDRPGREQDRPAAGRPGRRRAGDRRPRSATRPTDVLRDLGEDGRGRRGGARRDRRADPGARRRCRSRRRARSIFDSSYDQYRGVVAFVRVVDGGFRQGDGAARDGAGHASSRPRSSGSCRRRCGRSKELTAGEVGYVVTGLKDVSAPARRRHADRRRAAGRRAAARLQGRQADGLRRALPDRLRPVPGAPRRAREAEAERRVAVLRARDLAGARLRLPLRLPRPAAHGDRPRAARARVRPRPARHRAERRLPRDDARPARRSRCTTRRRCRARSSRSRSRTSRASIIVPKDVRRRGDGAEQRAARALRPHGVPLRGARAAALRPAARRDRARLLRPAEVADARLRELRLRLRRLPAGRPRRASTS